MVADASSAEALRGKRLRSAAGTGMLGVFLGALVMLQAAALLLSGPGRGIWGLDILLGVFQAFWVIGGYALFPLVLAPAGFAIAVHALRAPIHYRPVQATPPWSVQERRWRRWAFAGGTAGIGIFALALLGLIALFSH